MDPFKKPFTAPFSQLETTRLSIRVDTEETYIEHFRNSSDEELMRWCGFTKPEELEQQKLKIAGGFSNYRTSTMFFHLVEKERRLVIGSLAFHSWYQIHRRSEFGYAMTSEAHKAQGFMKEAVPEVLRFGFEAMDLNRIEAFIAPDNIPSRRLVEHAGFLLEGQLRQHYVHRGAAGDSMVYGLLRDDWAGS